MRIKSNSASAVCGLQENLWFI